MKTIKNLNSKKIYKMTIDLNFDTDMMVKCYLDLIKQKDKSKDIDFYVDLENIFSSVYKHKNFEMAQIIAVLDPLIYKVFTQETELDNDKRNYFLSAFLTVEEKKLKNKLEMTERIRKKPVL